MESDSCRQRIEIFTELLLELEAEDILTPISMTQLIDIEDTYEDIIDIISKVPHACYPVYRDGIDNILGILYIHDLLTHCPTPFNLHTILHTPVFISENKNLLELLDEFKKKQTSMAIVVDEHGAVRGVVTKTDILYELWNSKESEESLQHFIIEQGSAYLVDARLPLEEFNKKFDKELLCEDCDSIGGFVIEQFTYVPQLEEKLIISNITITVTKIEGAKLQELTVTFNEK